MTHLTHQGRTLDGVPYVITLHPDDTASGMLPSWQGGAYKAAPMSHAMARTLIESLPRQLVSRTYKFGRSAGGRAKSHRGAGHAQPGARALDGEADFLATKARREHPLPRKPSAWETRMRARLTRRTA
jgi:hypothetical protein